MQIENKDDCVIAKLETPGGYSAFKMGIDDRRNWTRHPETIELSKLVQDNHRHNNIVIQYGDTFTRLNLKK